MVNCSAETLGRTFSAVADPTRRAILARLARGEASVKELAAPFQISLPAISRHLRILEQAGLMHRRKMGRTHYCRLEAQSLGDAAARLAFYQRFWEGRLQSLDDFLNEEKMEPTHDKSRRKSNRRTLRSTRSARRA